MCPENRQDTCAEESPVLLDMNMFQNLRSSIQQKVEALSRSPQKPYAESLEVVKQTPLSSGG
jgi:hypothetical protein